VHQLVTTHGVVGMTAPQTNRQRGRVRRVELRAAIAASAYLADKARLAAHHEHARLFGLGSGSRIIRHVVRCQSDDPYLFRAGEELSDTVCVH